MQFIKFYLLYLFFLLFLQPNLLELTPVLNALECSCCISLH